MRQPRRDHFSQLAVGTDHVDLPECVTVCELGSECAVAPHRY